MGSPCDNCSLATDRVGEPIKGQGNLKAPILIVGDHPWPKDTKGGTPFLEARGKVLDEMLAHVGLGRRDVFVTNRVRCCPPNGSYFTEEHASACWPNLDKEASFIKPKVVVLLGELACKAFLGRTASQAQGRIWDSSESLVKFTWTSGTDAFKIVASHDPAISLENVSKRKDMEKAFELAKALTAERPKNPLDYKYAHTEEDVHKLLEEVLERCQEEGKLSFDIETSGLVWFERPHDKYIAEILSIAFSFRQREAYGICLRPVCRSPRVLEALRAVLSHPIQKGGHNGKFDNIMLRARMGIRVEGYHFDTMLAAHALDQSKKLKDLGLETLGPPARPDVGRWWEKVEKYLDKKTGYLKCPDDLLLEYNCTDADVTMALWDQLEPKIEEKNKEELIHHVMMPHLREIEEMELVGVRLDVPATEALGSSLLKRAREAEAECLKKIGRHPHWWDESDLKSAGIERKNFKPFNMGSPPQLAKLIYEELKVPVKRKTEKDQPSTSEDALLEIQDEHPFIKDLLVYRGLVKNMGNVGWEAKEKPKDWKEGSLFGDTWKSEGLNKESKGLLMWVGVDGRCHADLNIIGTVTGRISITNPALQTMPKTKEFRDLLIPADGYVFVNADFKGLELRILAMLSGDPEWLQIFRDGSDPHSFTASRMFNIPIKNFPPDTTKAERDAYFEKWNKEHSDKRKAAKGVNFGIPYGEGADGLADQLGVTKQEAQKWLDAWAKAYPAASRWLQNQVEEARKHKMCRYSLNRERPLPGFFSSNKGEVGEAERQARNTPIQGTGGDCLSICIARIHNKFRNEYGDGWRDKARIVLEVHDELLIEVQKDLAETVKVWVKEEMGRQMPMLPKTLPLEVDAEIKERWGGA